MAMPDYPSFRDLYEVQEKTDEKIEKVNTRLSRIEKGFIVLTVLVASPKFGGPEAAKLITAAFQVISG